MERGFGEICLGGEGGFRRRTLGKIVRGGLVAYNARLPSGLEVPAVLHRGAEDGGGSNRRREGK